MPDSQPSQTKPSSWHIAVAAEAFAAGQFARRGYDVSVQYGADQPGYDLIVAKGDHLMKVSVKGSQDGGWILAPGHLAKTKNSVQPPDYQGAINLWLKRYSSHTVFCFVQFLGVKVNEMPRIYLASPQEVAQRLRETRNGCGDAVLYEYWKWKRGPGAGTTDKIPDNWKLSELRIQELLSDQNVGLAVSAKA